MIWTHLACVIAGLVIGWIGFAIFNSAKMCDTQLQLARLIRAVERYENDPTEPKKNHLDTVIRESFIYL